MREIKFRVWDEKNDRMVIDFFVGSGGNCYRFDRDGPFLCPKLRMMQYTGLKDKNGVEIYEGDIVHVDRHCTAWFIEYGSFGDAAFYAINGLNSCRLLESGQFCAEFSIVAEPVECEVIGNIHENPELLK